jgi:hypothetical protein
LPGPAVSVQLLEISGLLVVPIHVHVELAI